MFAVLQLFFVLSFYCIVNYCYFRHWYPLSLWCYWPFTTEI